MARRRFTRDAILLAALLAAVLCIVFAPFLAGGRTLMMASQDVASLFPTGATNAPRADGSIGALAPRQKTVDYSSAWLSEPSAGLEHALLFDHHALPMWDPYDGLGTPFAAAMQPQPFYPLSALLALHPTPRTYDVFLIARLFLAGFGAALFLRLFAGFTPALCAGLAAAFGSYDLIYFDMPHLSVEVLLPLMLFGAELLARRATWARVAFFAAIVACNVVGGMPESTALDCAAVALYALVRLLGERRGAHAARRAFALVGGAVLGLALASIVVLPFLEYVPQALDVHQARNIGGLIVGTTADPCMPGCLPLEISPLAYGPPWNNLRTGFSGPSDAEGGYGLVEVWLAAVACIAALRALIRRRSSRPNAAVLTLAGIIIVLTLKRYGFAPVQWIGLLPVMRLIIFAKYGEGIVAPCLAILAGFGLSSLLQLVRRGTRTVWADLCALTLAVAACAAGAATIAPAVPHAWYLYGSLAFAVGMLGIAFAARAAAQMRRLPLRALAPALTVLIGVQAVMLYAVPMLYHFAAPVSTAANPFREPRYLQTVGGDLAGGYRTIGAGAVYRPNWAGAFGAFTMGDSNAMYPQTYMNFVHAFTSNGLDFSGIDPAAPLTPRLLALTSTRYVFMPKTMALPRYDRGDFTTIADPDVTILRYARPLARATVYRDVRIAGDDTAALRIMTAPHFDERHTAVIEADGAPAAASLHPCTSGGDGLTSDVSEPNAVTVVATLACPGLVMLDDNWFPGWRASIDGRDTPILRTDETFRGVVVAGGRHVVRFIYASRAVSLGLALSLAAFAVWLAFVVLAALGARTVRRVQSDASPLA